MASNLNKVILIGNVGKDPEIRSGQNGKEIAVLTIATTDSWKNKTTGEKTDKTEWHRVVVFDEGLVNVIKSYIKKGSKLYIEGSLQTRKWTDTNNQERYSTEIVLQGYSASIIMLDGGKGKEHTPNAPQAFNEASEELNLSDLDDEIPF